MLLAQTRYTRPMTDEIPPPDQRPPPPEGVDSRWVFLRDVAVFQAKMALDNLRDFALMPASLVAAGIDLAFKGEKEGSRFYRVLNWGKHSEEIINVYGAIDEDCPDEDRVNRRYTVDAVVERLERVIVREYEKGGTAADIKRAVDNAIDQLQRENGLRGEKASEAMKRAMNRWRMSGAGKGGADAA